jgi:hypothetical protein
MPKAMFSALLALALPALPWQGSALAGPSDGLSGKIVPDEVAKGLRQYHEEKDAKKRVARLERLARTRDPRVGVVLGQRLDCGFPGVEIIPAAELLGRHYAPPAWLPSRKSFIRGWHWWEQNEVDMRRRAKQLPR